MSRNRLRIGHMLALAGLTLLGFAAVGSAQAFQMAVSPDRFEFPLGTRPVAKSMQIINQSKKPMKVRLSTANFELDDRNQVREIKPEPQSLDQWILIRPLKLTIPPGETRTVRFAIRPFARPTPGEHRGMIFVEQDGKIERKPGQMAVRFRFGIALYGQTGSAIRKAEVMGIETDGRIFGLDIKSTGNALVRPEGLYGVWKAANFPGDKKARALLQKAKVKPDKVKTPDGAIEAGFLPASPVFHGYRRTVTSQFRNKLPKGDYRLVISGKVGNQKVERIEKFSVGS